MTQRTQRIEPTFGQPQDNVENTDAMHETFMPVLDEEIKEEVATSVPVNESDISASNDTISVNQSVSLSSRQIPNHTFEMPFRRPDEVSENMKSLSQENHNVAPDHIVREPLAVSDILSPALQVHNAQLASQQAQQTNLQASKNEVESVKSESVQTENVAQSSATLGALAGAATAGVAASALNKTEKTVPISGDVDGVVSTVNQVKGEDESMPKVPSKYRRLLLVILLALLLLLVFFLLKPSSADNNVNALSQQQGQHLPIEFRPVDEAEAQAAEAREAALLAQQQSTEQVQANEDKSVAVETEQENTESVKVAPVVQVERPKTQESVIHQEEVKKVEKSTTPTARSVEKLKPTVKVETTKPVVKPVATRETVKPKAVEKVVTKVENSAVSSSGASKTMTVPKGVSLMQVFRDNGLSANLSDVNAMSKTNNIVSNLKAGDKVTVKMSGGKVAEMSISSGGKFIRQADGSYRYVK